MSHAGNFTAESRRGAICGQCRWNLSEANGRREPTVQRGHAVKRSGRSNNRRPIPLYGLAVQNIDGREDLRPIRIRRQ